MHMKFKFEIFGKNSKKQIKLTKYIKNIKIRPNFKIEFKTMYYSNKKID